VPHRNRIQYLKLFYQYFKQAQNVLGNQIDIYVIDQNNEDLFNRGLLLNIGYSIANPQKYDRYIFHDVDSFPDHDLLPLYTQHIDKNIHFASPDLEYKYTYPEFCGGVIGLKKNDYEKINGFPNDFFGWGGEDDAFYNRLVKYKIKVYRPSKGKYEFDTSKVTDSEKNIDKKYNILKDLKNSSQNGLRQLKSLDIYIKPLLYTTFINDYSEQKSIKESRGKKFKDFISSIKPLSDNKDFNVYTYKITYSK
jgi:hypothetical protein